MELVQEEKPKQMADLQPKKPEPIKYDPNTQYTWDEGEVFAMSGAEFGILINAVRGFLSTENAQSVLLVSRAGAVADRILKRSVENGTARVKEDKQ